MNYNYIKFIGNTLYYDTILYYIKLHLTFIYLTFILLLIYSLTIYLEVAMIRLNWRGLDCGK